MGTESVCAMVPPSRFGLYLKCRSFRKSPAFFRTKTHRQALVSVDETRADVVQLFTNLFRIMDRKLGSGAYGEVWMAVDILHKRQMACKVVELRKSPQGRSGNGTFWREVDLLKDISHVRENIPLSTPAHKFFSQTSCMSSVSSLRRKSCTI